MEEPINVILKFEQLINSRLAEAVCSLLTPDSVFIDSLGNRWRALPKCVLRGRAISKWSPITLSRILRFLRTET